MRTIWMLSFALFGLIGCESEPAVQPPPPEETGMYFPPLQTDVWETISPDSLNWKADALEELYTFLESNNTRAFLVLKEGKIVTEKYWGNNITNTAAFTSNSNWYWASAGKTLTATLVGIAQEEGLLDIEDKSSDYLGQNWTSLSTEKEALITIRHQLAMTTGLDYEVQELDCTEPGCLQYKAAPGTQWYYHNAPYTLLEKIVANAAGIPYNRFTDERIEQKIGMSGSWIESGYNNVYWSKPRDAARFGLLMLNKGIWDEEVVLGDTDFYEAMVNSSQTLNPSYGYLWWLNGKASAIFPSLAQSFNTSVAPDAPADMFCRYGKKRAVY